MSEIRPKERQESTRKYKEAVQPHLGGRNVEAVGAFHRPEFGGDAEFLYRPFRSAYERLTKGNLGQLPQTFLLVVTRGEVYAFSYKQTRSDVNVLDRRAIFDRDAIHLEHNSGRTDWLGCFLSLGTRSISSRQPRAVEPTGSSSMPACLTRARGRPKCSRR